MKNSVEIDKNAAMFLPNNRPYTRMEALFELTIETQNGIDRSAHAYARRWQWGRNRAEKFINDIKSEEGFQDKRTVIGRSVRLINNDLQRQSCNKQAQKEIPEIYLRAAQYAIDQIRKTHPDITLNGHIKQKAATEFEKLVRIDKKSLAQLRKILDWLPGAPRDSKSGFCWADQIQSPLKIRRKDKQGVLYYDKLMSAMRRGSTPEPKYHKDL